jgi:putative transposase
VFALQQAEAGTLVAEVCRKLGVAEPTFYRWKKRYQRLGGVGGPAAEAVGGGEPAPQSTGGGSDAEPGDAAGRAAGKSLTPARSTHRYRSVADRRAEVRTRLRDLAAARPHWRYRRLGLLLRRAGWNMGLMSDQLVSGQPIRVLTIVDNFSQESLALKVGLSLRGEDVVGVLNGLIRERGRPHRIRRDNGTEFTSQIVDQWAHWNRVVLDSIRPGKPMENGLIEGFHSRLRQECLDECWFLSVADARQKIEAWRQQYDDRGWVAGIESTGARRSAAVRAALSCGRGNHGLAGPAG